MEKFYSTLGKHRAVAVFSSPPGAFIGSPVFLLYCSLEWYPIKCLHSGPPKLLKFSDVMP